MRDYHQLIGKETKLSEFRKLFSTCDLNAKITLLDHLKFYAILKFLKKKNIITVNQKYLSSIPKLFKLEKDKEIKYTSLQGSKTSLTPKEEKQFFQIFN